MKFLTEEVLKNLKNNQLKALLNNMPPYPLGSGQYGEVYYYYIATKVLLDALPSSEVRAVFGTIETTKSGIQVAKPCCVHLDTKERLLAVARDIINNANAENYDDELPIMPMPNSLRDYFKALRDNSYDYWSASLSVMTWVDVVLFEPIIDYYNSPDYLVPSLNLHCESFITGWNTAWLLHLYPDLITFKELGEWDT